MSRHARHLFRTPRAGEDGSDNESSSDVSSSIDIDDDAPSAMGGEQHMSAADAVDAFRAVLESLAEKRTSTREEALQKLLTLLGGQLVVLRETLDNYQDTLFDLLLRMAKKDKSPAENMLAAKALALYFIVLGAHHEAKYHELCAALIPLVARTSARSTAVQSAIIDTLCLACFIADGDNLTTLTLAPSAAYTDNEDNNDDNENDTDKGYNGDSNVVQASNTDSTGQCPLLKCIETLVRKCSAQSKDIDEKIAVSALRGLGLFATLLNHNAVQVLFQRTLPHHLALVELTSSSSEIRISAGENIALFFELLNELPFTSTRSHPLSHSFSALDLQVYDPTKEITTRISVNPSLASDVMTRSYSDDTRLSSASTERRTRQRTLSVTRHLTHSACVACQSRVLAAFDNMQSSSVKSLAKRDRGFQRSAFRDIQATIEYGELPHLKLNFKKETVEFGSWVELKRLYAFREALGQSLHVHFISNPLMRDVFDMQLSYEATLTNQERRALFNPSSEVSKSRTKHRKQQRGAKANKHGMEVSDE